MEFRVKIGEFFWRIILNAENYKEDLVENCINKYAEMVKKWSLDQKETLFFTLTKQLAIPDKHVIPTLRLLTQLIKDHKNSVSSSKSKVSTTSTAVGETS